MTEIPDSPSKYDLYTACSSRKSGVAGSAPALKTPPEAIAADRKLFYYSAFAMILLSNVMSIYFIWNKTWRFDAFFWNTFTIIAILIYVPLWLRHLWFMRPAGSNPMRRCQSDSGSARHINFSMVITVSMIPVVLIITAFMIPSIMWLSSYLRGHK